MSGAIGLNHHGLGRRQGGATLLTAFLIGI
jgi:hypothetical protein